MTDYKFLDFAHLLSLYSQTNLTQDTADRLEDLCYKQQRTKLSKTEKRELKQLNELTGQLQAMKSFLGALIYNYRDIVGREKDA